jgi:two-component system LytT family response regulator
MRLRTLIVDDEAPARDRLHRLLSELPDVELIGEAENGVQAVELIERKRPDLLFLDIQMPGLDGFGVLEALQEAPAVVFVTAYDEYAIRAFEVNALDYLLKPYSRKRLEEAVRRAMGLLLQGGTPAANLRPLLASLAEQGQYMKRLAVWYRSSIRLLDVEEIDWIGIEEDQVVVHVGGEGYAVRRTLSDMEARLDPSRFFRAHRSAIVNLDRVQEIIPWFKGSHKLRLTTGEEVELSRSRSRDLRAHLEW